MTIKRGGVINLRSQSLKEGETAEVIVLVESAQKTARRTAADLLASDLTGIWADREDLGDSLEFAHSLRRQAKQNRIVEDRKIIQPYKRQGFWDYPGHSCTHSRIL